MSRLQQEEACAVLHLSQALTLLQACLPVTLGADIDSRLEERLQAVDGARRELGRVAQAIKSHLEQHGCVEEAAESA